MKNFKTFITELLGTSHQDLALDKNMNMAGYADPAVIRKLNAWVEAGQY